MNNSASQLLHDVEWLEDNLNIVGRECDEVLAACERLGGLSAEYFCEESLSSHVRMRTEKRM